MNTVSKDCGPEASREKKRTDNLYVAGLSLVILFARIHDNAPRVAGDCCATAFLISKHCADKATLLTEDPAGNTFLRAQHSANASLTDSLSDLFVFAGKSLLQSFGNLLGKCRYFKECGPGASRKQKGTNNLCVACLALVILFARIHDNAPRVNGDCCATAALSSKHCADSTALLTRDPAGNSFLRAQHCLSHTKLAV